MTRNKREVTPFGETPLLELTFDQLMQQGVIDISEVDDVMQVEQDELVGVTFILVDWEIKQSNSITRDGIPTEYAIVRVRTTDGLRVFADGGAGIADALERYKNKTEAIDNPLLYFHYGLRASEYTYTDPHTGDKTPARTFYFDNRPRP